MIGGSDNVDTGRAVVEPKWGLEFKQWVEKWGPVIVFVITILGSVWTIHREIVGLTDRVGKLEGKLEQLLEVGKLEGKLEVLLEDRKEILDSYKEAPSSSSVQQE